MSEIKRGAQITEAVFQEIQARLGSWEDIDSIIEYCESELDKQPHNEGLLKQLELLKNKKESIDNTGKVDSIGSEISSDDFQEIINTIQNMLKDSWDKKHAIEYCESMIEKYPNHKWLMKQHELLIDSSKNTRSKVEYEFSIIDSYRDEDGNPDLKAMEKRYLELRDEYPHHKWVEIGLEKIQQALSE